MANDPIAKLRRWLTAARSAGAPLAEAVALATADARGRPSVRFVLIKEIEDDAIVFYTNALSRKGRELRINPRASLAAYWDATGKQVRVEGKIEEVTSEEADAYWAERPRASQLASAASAQSRPLASRKGLLAKVRQLERKYRAGEVPRPRHWIGYRLIADRIEFWTRHEPRLHDRELFVRRKRRWQRSLLQP